MSTATVIDPKIVKELRERTHAGMMDCKNALTEANGNPEEAEKILRKKFNLSASKKAGREAREGVIASYIHLGGKVGVLVEVNCETDFVAKNESFRDLVKDITLQIAAASPIYVSRQEVPEKALHDEKEVAAAQIKGKPEAVVEKIVAGKVEKYYTTVCLMEQAFVKDANLTIKDLVTSKIGELGENIVIRRFTRFAVGEGADTAPKPETT
ncbi:MAG: translation elongation factor Ts [Aliarcobacter sp.]